MLFNIASIFASRSNNSTPNHHFLALSTICLRLQRFLELGPGFADVWIWGLYPFVFCSRWQRRMMGPSPFSRPSHSRAPTRKRVMLLVGGLSLKRWSSKTYFRTWQSTIKILNLYIIFYIYSLVSLLSIIYPFPAMHSLLVTIICTKYLIGIKQELI